MQDHAVPKFSATELGSATDELEGVQATDALDGDEGHERFTQEDVERVRLIQFLERRQIGLDKIASVEHDEAVLASVVKFLFPNGVRRTYSFAQAADLVGVDAALARRLGDAARAGDEPLDQHDVAMLREAKRALDAGFPETALLQLMHVYADALERVAGAEVRLYHFSVREGLKAAGLSGARLLHNQRSVRARMLPAVDALLGYFHRRGLAKAARDVLVLHFAEDVARPALVDAKAQLRVAILFLDISSYTRLTEIMGDTVAARIVDRFSELVHE